MNTRWLPQGATECIEAQILDALGAPLTGLHDIALAIRRTSDNWWLDFNDGHFKPALWVLRQVIMAEVDPVLAPGVYAFTWITPNAIEDYRCVVAQVPATTYTQVLIGELRVGGVPDDCTEARQKLLNDEIITPGVANNWTTLDDAGLNPLFRHDVTDPSGGPVVIPPGTPARRHRTL